MAERISVGLPLRNSRQGGPALRRRRLSARPSQLAARPEKRVVVRLEHGSKRTKSHQEGAEPVNKFPGLLSDEERAEIEGDDGRGAPPPNGEGDCGDYASHAPRQDDERGRAPTIIKATPFIWID